MPVPDSFKD